MGQNEENNTEAEDEEFQNTETIPKKNSFLASLNINALLKELLRFLIFLLFTLLIIFLVQGKDQERFSLNEIKNIDNKDLNIIGNAISTKEWVSEEMLINSADEFANHFVKATLVINYNTKNSELERIILSKKNLIYSETRKIIGKRKYLELKNYRNQEIIIEEITTLIRRIIQLPGIKNVFFKDFTIH